MGEHKLTQIQEIEIVYKNIIPKNERIQIKSSKDAFYIFKNALDDVIQYKEFFYIILLNNANDVLGISKISEGGITSTIVDVRLIFQKALKANATALILGHNHPSGKTQPSTADKTVTEKIQEGAKFLDIKILDHLIVTSETYFSFTDENIL